MLFGLRTAIYKVNDLARATDWYAQAFGVTPYFDQPFYVGFNVGGFELGLDPDPGHQGSPHGVQTYWGVDDVEKAYQRLLELGAKPHDPPKDVGGSIKVAAVIDPFGNVFGLIFNPHFDVTKVR